MFNKHKFIILTILFLLAGIVLFFYNLSLGYSSLNFIDFIFPKNETEKFIISFRINKNLTIIFAGIALPVSGFLLQELFKNPLASPSVLGVSSASSLGVALLIFVGIPPFLKNSEFLSGWILTLSAMAGAILISLLLISIIKYMKDGATFIIVGILISAFCGSIIGTLQFYSASEALKQYVIWSFGSFSSLTTSQTWILFICILLGLLPAFISIKMLQGFLLGEQYAKVIGVNLSKMQLLIILSSCILVGSTTAMLGPIVFIGIIIPHFCRQIWNPSHLYKQLILNILVGINFMLIIGILLDLTKLPVNIISTIIGFPTAIFMIFNKRQKTFNL